MKGNNETMFSKITEALSRPVSRFEREEGQGLTEYGLILALVALVSIAGLTALGLAVAGFLGGITF
jgi:Flp pilus assembly pilin Flp